LDNVLVGTRVSVAVGDSVTVGVEVGAGVKVGVDDGMAVTVAVGVGGAKSGVAHDPNNRAITNKGKMIFAILLLFWPRL
jgi:hypothetical protein